MINKIIKAIFYDSSKSWGRMSTLATARLIQTDTDSDSDSDKITE